MIALIDADIICYLASAAAEHTIDWQDGDEPQQLADKAEARRVAYYAVGEWMNGAKCSRAFLAFSDRSRKDAAFRHQLYPDYKGHRVAVRPLLHDWVKAALEHEYRHRAIAGLEGDDVMGLWGSGPDMAKYVMVSNDKDMLTVPGHHYNPMTRKRRTIDMPTANWNWMFQTLVGDRTDNFKGCPKIGEVNAARLLGPPEVPKSLETLWGIVLGAFEDAAENGKLETDPFETALLNVRCARILRYGDYDGRNKLVRLWHPDEDKVEWLSAEPPAEEETDGGRIDVV